MSNIITMVLYKEKRSKRMSVSDVMWQSLDSPLMALKMEGNHEPRNVGGLYMLEKKKEEKKSDSSLEPKIKNKKKHPSLLTSLF